MAEIWPRTASITVRRLSTKPATDTTKKSSGIRPTMKLNARPEARNMPRRARNVASAVRSAAITGSRPLDHAPDEAAVHLHRDAGDIGSPGRGQEDHHGRELLRGADASHRDVRRRELHLLLQRD